MSQKLLLVFLGVALSLIGLEASLRLGGLLLGSPQSLRNLASQRKVSDHRILTLGESTTAGSRNWPAFLQEALNRRSPKSTFSVFNGAVAGTSTPFILSRLDRQLDRYRPDIVIAMMGTNDSPSVIGFSDEADLADRRPPPHFALRIVKLARWLKAGLRNQRRPSYEGKPAPGSRPEAPDPARTAAACFIEGDLNKANERFARIPRERLTGGIAREWARCLTVHERFKEAEAKFAIALRLSPDDPDLLSDVGSYFCDRRNIEKGEPYLRKAIALAPDTPLLYEKLAHCLETNGAGKEKVARFLDRNLLYLRVGETRGAADITRAHYNKLHAILKKRGIRLIAMQYPTKSLDELKAHFDAETDILFLGNEDNFFRALSKGRYEDYFLDRFGTTFGHATDAGNRLIAENAAQAVLELLGLEARTVKNPSPDREGRELSLLQSFARHWPRNTKAWLDLAGVAARQKKRRLALDSLARAERLEMGTEEMRHAVRIYNDFGESRAALKVLDKLALKLPGDASVRIVRAEVLMAASENGQALKSLERAEALSPDDSELRMMMHLYNGLEEPARAFKAAETLTAKHPADASLWITRAELLRKLERRDEALTALRRARSLDPSGSELRSISRLYQSLNDLERALETVDALIEKNKDEASLRVARTDLLLRLGRRGEALSALSHAETLGPNDAALRQMLNLYRELEHHKEGLKTAAALSAKHPGDSSLQTTRARLLLELGRREEALAALRRAQSLTPDDSDLRQIAGLYNALDDPGRALEIVRALAAKYPGEASLQLSHAELLWRLGRRDQAREGVKRVEALAPGEPERRRMMNLFHGLGDLKRALEITDSLASKHPGEASLRITRAEILRDLGRRDEALADLKRAASLNPGQAESLRMTNLLRGLEDFGRALIIMEALAAKHPENASLQIGYAGALIESGRPDEALSVLERAQTLKLSDDELRRAARGYQTLGRCPRALAIWKGLLSAARPLAKDLSDKAVCEFLSGNKEGAVSDLKKAIELAPKSLEARLSLGMLYSGMGARDTALAVYESALAVKDPVGAPSLRQDILKARDALRRKEAPDAP